MVYFVTWCLHRTQRRLASDERTVVVSAIRHFDRSRYRLIAYVVMDDHVHVICRPNSERLENLVRSWKSYSAYRMQREFGRIGRVWQNEYHDRIIRSGAELRRKIAYVLNNPFRRWPTATHYSWVWSIASG